MTIEIVQIVGLALIATFLILLLQPKQPEIALIIGLATGAIIFLYLLAPLESALELISSLSGQAGVNHIYIQTLLKIIGVAYISEFGAHIARDADQEAIAAKIELAGKIIIIMLAIPIFQVLIETILTLMPRGT